MKTHAHGAKLSWNGAIVAELKNIGGIELTTDTIDVTSHSSADGFKDFIAGLKEASDVPVDGLLDMEDTAGQQAMLADFDNGVARNTSIIFPETTGASWNFMGIITKIKIGDLPVDGAIPFSATVKPKGKPSFDITQSAGLTTPFFAISESAVINPSPAADVHEYIATVLTGVSSVTVTTTALAGEITVNGNVVASGDASSSIALGAAGSVTEITIVVKETNKAPVTYKVLVSRP